MTTEAPPRARPEPPAPHTIDAVRPGTQGVTRAIALVRRHPWAFSAGAIILAALILVRAADTRPGFDPFGWMVWGQQTLRWSLDTNGAPSWKPMPYLLTVPYSAFGHYQLWVWMLTSVACSLSGLVFAWRIAHRLAPRPQDPSLPAAAVRAIPHIAGFVAAATLLGIDNYAHFILSDQSDTMIVTTCLAAIDCQLNDRLRWAFLLWLAGSLGRPEVWPFLGLFSLWAFRARPEMRRLLIGGLLLVPLLWFGIPALTAKSFFVAGNNALNSPRQLHGNKITGTLNRFTDLYPTALWLAALLGTALAVRRRDRPVVLIAIGAVVWVVVEIAFAIHGWPAVPRYLFEAAAAAGLLVGLGVAYVLAELPALLRRLAPMTLSPGHALAAAAVPVLALGVLMVPVARSRLSVERHDLHHERARAKRIDGLRIFEDRFGTARILSCGQPVIPIEYQSVLSWTMQVNVGILYSNPHKLKALHKPYVEMAATPHGWSIRARNIRRSSCRHVHMSIRVL